MTSVLLMVMLYTTPLWMCCRDTCEALDMLYLDAREQYLCVCYDPVYEEKVPVQCWRDK